LSEVRSGAAAGPSPRPLEPWSLSSVTNQTIDPAGAVFNHVNFNDGWSGTGILDDAAGNALDWSGYDNSGVPNGAPLPTAAQVAPLNFSKPPQPPV
jgi:hypothetical protein